MYDISQKVRNATKCITRMIYLRQFFHHPQTSEMHCGRLKNDFLATTQHELRHCAQSGEREEEGRERVANNGRQPKHPINLTGPDLKPRGVLNSLTPNADAGATLTLRYTLTEKGAMPCAIAGRYGGVAKGWQRVCTVRWFHAMETGKREGCDVRPMKNQTERIPPVLLLFHLRFSSIHPVPRLG